MSEKIKIGIIGTGHLGQIHLKLLNRSDLFEITGFFDTDAETCRKIEQEYGISSFESPDELIKISDAIDIVTPTPSHFLYAQKAVKAGKHIFIEKPLTETTEQGQELVNLVEEAGVKAQIGHVERFNPAILKADEYSPEPKFIEGHRLAEFNPRGTEVSVIMDLMIHDIDLAFHMIKSPIKSVSASGVAVVSDTPDISNARLTFENGAVANLTASRISVKKMRKLRLFQKNAYISIDMLNKELEVFNLVEANKDSNPWLVINTDESQKGKEIDFQRPKVEDVNSIELELTDFAESILKDQSPKVPIDEAFESLKTAHEIQEQIDSYKLT